MSELRKNQSGFSMIELIVVMVIIMIIMAATFSLMRSTITTANANYQMTDATQGLRNAQEFLTRDILTAGDGLKGIANIWLPTDFVKKYLTARPVSELDPDSRGYLSLGAILSDNNVPAGTAVLGLNPATTVLSPTDRISLLSVDTNFPIIDVPAGASNYNTGRINIPASRIGDFSAGEIYYISSGGTGAFGTVTSVDPASNAIYWANGDPLALNRTGGTGMLASATNFGTSPATLKRVQIIHYFVDADGKLIRRVFGVQDAAFTDSVIAEHLISLQFRYVKKPSEAGTLILSQPVEQLAMDELSLARMIEPSVMVETAYPLQDGIKHQVEGTSQIGIRNVQFLEAPVPQDREGNTDPPVTGPVPVVTPVPPPPPPPPPPTPVPSPTPTPVPTPIPSPTATPVRTPTPVPTATPVRTPTPVPTPVPSTPTPTPTPTPRPKGDG
jgi:prepilin-type N-terminal cleavage/methylation domain-containing protein